MEKKLFLEEGKSIESHATKNKIVAEKWRELSVSEKKQYFERSRASSSDNPVPKCSWKEASRILRNLESSVSMNILPRSACVVA